MDGYSPETESSTDLQEPVRSGAGSPDSPVVTRRQEQALRRLARGPVARGAHPDLDRVIDHLVHTGRAQAVLASQSGMEQLKLSFNGSGAWRAEFLIAVDNDPAMAAALAATGFRAGKGGFRLTTTGRF